MGSRRLLLVAILGLCFFSRAVIVVAVLDANPAAVREGDSRSYTQPARALIQDGSFRRAPDDPQPEFVRTPGYPALIATVYGLFGESPTALLLVQVALSTLTVLVVYLLAARMWSVPTALLAAALVTLEPLQLYSAGTIVSEGLATLLLILVAAAGFCVFSRAKPKLRWLVALGFVMAAATLVRPVTYYLPLFVVLLLGWSFLRRRTERRYVVKMLVAFLLPVVVIVGGWQLRNRLEVGSWRFSAVEAQNLYLYRGGGVVADRDGISLEAAMRRLRNRLGLATNEDQGAYYGRMYREGVDILVANPLEAAEGAAKGLFSELTTVRYKTFSYVGMDSVPIAVEAVALVLLLGFYAVALYGMTMVVRARRDVLAHVFVIGVAAYVLLVSAGPEAVGGRGERFRAVVMPILILYAAFGARQVWHRTRAKRFAVDSGADRSGRMVDSPGGTASGMGEPR